MPVNVNIEQKGTVQVLTSAPERGSVTFLPFRKCQTDDRDQLLTNRQADRGGYREVSLPTTENLPNKRSAISGTGDILTLELEFGTFISDARTFF